MTELPPIARKTNFRDYSSVAMSDFIDILRVKYNLTEDIEYLNDLKFAYLQSLCKYYVVSEHPDGIDLSKRKKKRDPSNKKPMSSYNRFMKIHYCDVDIAQINNKLRMNAVSKLWKAMSPEQKNLFKIEINTSEMEKQITEKLDILLEKKIITSNEHIEKNETLAQIVKIEIALENQERIKKEEVERQNRSKLGSQSDIVPEVEPEPEPELEIEEEKIIEEIKPEAEPEPELEIEEKIIEEKIIEEIKPTPVHVRQKRGRGRKTTK